jgi:hypothetical protein
LLAKTALSASVFPVLRSGLPRDQDPYKALDLFCLPILAQKTALADEGKAYCKTQSNPEVGGRIELRRRTSISELRISGTNLNRTFLKKA